MLLSKPNRDAKASALVLRFAGKRVCSRSEALAYLRRRGISPLTAARVLQSKVVLQVVDDRACACLWSNHWARLGFSASAIKEKLLSKGIDAQAVERALVQLQSEESDESRAKSYLEQKHGKTPIQQSRALAARGFDQELISNLVGLDAEP